MKKLISVILAVAMILALLPTFTIAAEASTFKDVTGNEYYADAAEALAKLSILTGYVDGTFGADRAISRAEMAAIICRMIDKEEAAGKAKGSVVFDDVSAGHWASGYIKVASDEGIINGNGLGSFMPDNDVKYEEALKMVVCAIGLGDDIEINPEDWSAGYVAVAQENGITVNLKGRKGVASTRGDVAVMVYNGLSKTIAAPTASVESGTYYTSQSVTLTSTTENVEIYYTTDGSTPTVNSSLYKTPVRISSTSTLKAVAVKNGVLVSDVMSVEYTIRISTGGGGGGGSSSSSSSSSSSYNVSFNLNYTGAPAGPDTQKVKKNEYAERPEDPERDGYMFAGWFTDKSCTKEFDFEDTKITKTTTLYAKWEEVDEMFTVTFDLNYEGAEVMPEDQQINNGEYAERPDDPKREGYEFAGWFTDKECTAEFDFETTTIDKDITLYAKWEGAKKAVYTVSFDLNYEGAESVPENQQVNAGERADIPEEPNRIGFNFAGWYTDPDCEDEYLFSFESEIDKDITLYAKWVLSDELEDPDDTEVTDDDQFILSSSVAELMPSDKVAVTFKVQSTVTIPYFELYLDDEKTGTLLYDDGNYAVSGDDIPNDGCYTGTYTVHAEEETTLTFVAKAVVGDTEVVTNEVDILVIGDLTDEQLEQMEEIENNISELMDEAISGLDPDADESEKAEARYSLIWEYLKELEKEGIITNLEYDADTYIISFEYTDTGIDGAVECYDFYSDDNSVDNGNVREYIPADLFEEVSLLSMNDSELNYITYKEKAIILNYCSANDPDQSDRIAAYNGVGEILSDAGFAVENKYSVTVDDFRLLQDYQVVITDCHGSYYKNSPVICTDQSVTNQNKKQYSSDLKKKRIASVTTTDGKTSYWIYPQFFTDIYAKAPLKCNIFYLNVCKGAYKTTKLVDAINKDAGADSVIAYSDTVYTFYGTAMLTDIVEELLAGNTVDDAVDAAKQSNGANDHVWGNNKGFSSLKSEKAVCKVYGNKSAKIHNELTNGAFDSVLSVLGNSLTPWYIYGDARSIYRLSGLYPKSLPKMSIISSGFGSMNSQTTSCIYQTFLVPEDADTLSFSYDVVSEEPMEYVGSIYDDKFYAEILNTDGDVLETLAYESVNTSKWYLVSGIDFPGGDETTYHTRWQDTSYDISKYRNKLIVLRFSVFDSGDAIYDTAVLIDSVSVK